MTKKQDSRTLKDDIEAAEKMLLVISWVGVFSSIALVGYSVGCLP